MPLLLQRQFRLRDLSNGAPYVEYGRHHLAECDDAYVPIVHPTSLPSQKALLSIQDAIKSILYGLGDTALELLVRQVAEHEMQLMNLQVNDPPLEAVAFNFAPRRRSHTILVNQIVVFVEILGACLLFPAI